MARTVRDNIISVTNIGAFREDIYGLDQELSVSLMDDKISFEFHGVLYGDQVFKKNEFIKPSFSLFNSHKNLEFFHK